MSWSLGDTSKKYEVGNGGPGTVSSGRGDRGGVSYGTYQLSSKMGTVAKFIKVMGYSEQFRGLTPGTPLFSAKWKKLALENDQFGKDQHEFIKKTHFNVQINYLKNNNIDLITRGPAVLDAIWSTSVQFGGGTSLIVKSLKNIKSIENLSDEEIVSLIQDYKIRNNDILFRSSSSKVRASTLKRAINEKNDLIALSKLSKNESIKNMLKNLFDSLTEIGENF